MSELREHVLENLAIQRTVPFSYDHAEGMFTFGDEQVRPEQIPRFGMVHKSGQETTPELVDELSAVVPFLHTFRSPIGTAAAQIFMREAWTPALGLEATEIMADVFLELSDRYDRSEKERLLKSRNFHIVPNPDSSGVVLNTVGICACLGPDFTVHYDWHPVGFQEYTYHNVDHSAKRASLLAGLGHIAKVAADYMKS